MIGARTEAYDATKYIDTQHRNIGCHISLICPSALYSAKAHDVTLSILVHAKYIMLQKHILRAYE